MGQFDNAKSLTSKNAFSSIFLVPCIATGNDIPCIVWATWVTSAKSVKYILSVSEIVVSNL